MSRIFVPYVCNYCHYYISTKGFPHAPYCETLKSDSAERSAPAALEAPKPAWASLCPCGDFWSVCDMHRDQGPEVKDSGALMPPLQKVAETEPDSTTTDYIHYPIPF